MTFLVNNYFASGKIDIIQESELSNKNNQ